MNEQPENNLKEVVPEAPAENTASVENAAEEASKKNDKIWEVNEKYARFIGGRNSTEPHNSEYYRSFVEQNIEEEANGGPTNNNGLFGKNSRIPSIIILSLILIAYIVFTIANRRGQLCDPGRNDRIDNSVIDVLQADYLEGSSEWTTGANFDAEMQHFYTRTKVHPFIYDVTGQEEHSAEEMQKIADTYYADSIKDEDTFLIVFQGSDTSYKTAYHVGSNVSDIINADALTTFEQNISDCFKNSGIPRSDVLPTAINASAEILQQIDRPKMAIFLIIVFVIMLYGVFIMFRNLRRKDKLEAQLRKEGKLPSAPIGKKKAAVAAEETAEEAVGETSENASESAEAPEEKTLEDMLDHKIIHQDHTW